MGSGQQVAKNLAQPNPQAMINLALLVTHQGPSDSLLRRCRQQNVKNPGSHLKKKKILVELPAGMQHLQVITGGSGKVMNGKMRMVTVKGLVSTQDPTSRPCPLTAQTESWVSLPGCHPSSPSSEMSPLLVWWIMT